MALLWTVLVLSIVVFTVGTTMRSKLIRWARAGNSGSEYFHLALNPLFRAETVLKFLGGLSGLALAVLLETTALRIATGILGGLLLAMGALTAVVVVRSWWSDKELDRVVDQTEMLELIRSGAVSAFCKEADGRVTFQHAEKRDENGNHLYRPTSADPQGYPAYVAAANDLRRRHGHTTAYHNLADPHDPLSPGPLWITVDEATELLRAGEIRTFSYRHHPSDDQIPKSGEPTGITLLDHGWVRHLIVGNAMESALVPIAREAQRQHGTPQFCVNNHYEPR